MSRLKNPILNEFELSILQLLWSENRPLSRPEILDSLFPDDKNKQTSVHRYLNNLLEQGYITISGSVLCGKIYGRTYAPAITREEYISLQIAKLIPSSSPKKRILGLVSSFIEEDYVDDSVLSDLEELIQKKRKDFHHK